MNVSIGAFLKGYFASARAGGITPIAIELGARQYGALHGEVFPNDPDPPRLRAWDDVPLWLRCEPDRIRVILATPVQIEVTMGANAG